MTRRPPERGAPSIDKNAIDYREILERTPLVPWVADARTWRFSYVGAQAVDLLGFPVEDWYNPSFWSDRIHPDDRDEAVSTCMTLSEKGGSYEFDYRMLRSDGEVIWVNDIVSVEMGDTGPVTLRGFLIDISQQKALAEAVEGGRIVETELKANERVLRQMVNSLPALMAFADDDQRYRFVNDNYAAWFNLNPAQLVGRTTREVMGDEAYALIRHKVEGVLRGENQHSEMVFPASDGTPRHVEVSHVPHFDENGSVLGYFVIVVDVTERVNAQTADRDHRETLAHFSRVATMGELATSIAHELNQPLAAITVNAQAASRFLAMTPPNLEEIDGALGDIAGDAKRAAKVIRHMRDLLRKGEPREELIDIVSLIDETAEMLMSDAIARDCSITVESASDVPLLFGDPIQLKQVILNLVVNAFDAISEEGGVPGALTITTSSSNEEVEISIRDNGPGMPDDVSEDCFAPFVTTKPEGLGMGLTISRSIVEAHGGKLVAETNPEGGATLRVLLPVPSGAEG